MSYSNKYTSQTPKAGSTIKLVLAERCYIAPADTAYDNVAARLDGADPAAPWVDLGSVEGSKVNMTYNKETAYIETGIDKVRRGAYLRGKNAQAKFTLSQFDSAQLEALGVNSDSNTGATGKKLYIGQEDVVEKAMLFVGTNKIDGKEHHTYSKRAQITFGYAEADDARVIEVTAELSAFVPNGETLDALYVLFILDAA